MNWTGPVQTPVTIARLQKFLAENSTMIKGIISQAWAGVRLKKVCFCVDKF